MNLNNPDELKREVMLRVHAIYWLRKLGEPVFVKSLAFLALLVIFLTKVSVPDVLANLASSAGNFSNAFFFLASAFSDTLLLVKLIIIAELIVGLTLVRDAVKHLPFARVTSGIVHSGRV